MPLPIILGVGAAIAGVVGVGSGISGASKMKEANDISEEEKTATQNAILLVGLLRKMCKVSLVKKAETADEMNEVNQEEVDRTIWESGQVIGRLGLQR